jgi:hypothetical protein
MSPSSSSDDLASLAADVCDITSLSTGTGVEVDTKRKRLARKAALARESRKRKKSRLAEMESEVDRLREELHRVRTERGLPSLPPHTPCQEHDTNNMSISMSSMNGSSVCASPTPSMYQQMATSPCFSTSSSSPITLDDATPLVKIEAPSSPLSPYASPELPLPATYVDQQVVATVSSPSSSSNMVTLVAPEAALPSVTPIVASSSSSSLSDDGEQGALAMAMQQIIASGSIAQAAATSLAAMVTPTIDGGITTTGDVTATALAVGAANKQLEGHIDSLLGICQRKSTAAEAHLSSLDKLLVPCMPLRFLEWFLTQKDSFYCDTGLWQTLCHQILSLSNQQVCYFHQIAHNASIDDTH